MSDVAAPRSCVKFPIVEREERCQSCEKHRCIVRLIRPRARDPHCHAKVPTFLFLREQQRFVNAGRTSAMCSDERDAPDATQKLRFPTLTAFCADSFCRVFLPAKTSASRKIITSSAMSSAAAGGRLSRTRSTCITARTSLSAFSRLS